jgi:hypothetical protein
VLAWPLLAEFRLAPSYSRSFLSGVRERRVCTDCKQRCYLQRHHQHRRLVRMCCALVYVLCACVCAVRLCMCCALVYVLCSPLSVIRYGLFCELAGANTTDTAAEQANLWLKPRGLPTLPPVDSTEGLWSAIISGKNENKRSILHNSDTAVTRWPWKLVTVSALPNSNALVFFSCSLSCTPPQHLL